MARPDMARGDGTRAHCSGRPPRGRGRSLEPRRFPDTTPDSFCSQWSAQLIHGHPNNSCPSTQPSAHPAVNAHRFQTRQCRARPHGVPTGRTDARSWHSSALAELPQTARRPATVTISAAVSVVTSGTATVQRHTEQPGTTRPRTQTVRHTELRITARPSAGVRTTSGIRRS